MGDANLNKTVGGMWETPKAKDALIEQAMKLVPPEEPT